jgi:hypothetical protein
MSKKVAEEIKAFISYSSLDKEIASVLQETLSYYKIVSFLAHENIEISQEWETRIINELQETNFFICLLSKNFLKSPYCLQETGIALILKKPIIPLSLDKTVSPGFISKCQSKSVTKESLSIEDIIPGLLRFHKIIAIDIIFDIIKNSNTFISAEINFELIAPVFSILTKNQCIKLIDIILNNGQILGAGKCLSIYLPDFIKKCSKKIPNDKLKELNTIIKTSQRITKK